MTEESVTNREEELPSSRVELLKKAVARVYSSESGSGEDKEVFISVSRGEAGVEEVLVGMDAELAKYAISVCELEELVKFLKRMEAEEEARPFVYGEDGRSI
ncbi:MAG: hypothetical protein ABIH99_03420, partial [Candidatus Micrarchaeota archaeon]